MCQGSAQNPHVMEGLKLTEEKALCTLIDLAIRGARCNDTSDTVLDALQAIERVMQLCEDAGLIDKLEEVTD